MITSTIDRIHQNALKIANARKAFLASWRAKGVISLMELQDLFPYLILKSSPMPSNITDKQIDAYAAMKVKDRQDALRFLISDGWFILKSDHYEINLNHGGLDHESYKMGVISDGFIAEIAIVYAPLLRIPQDQINVFLKLQQNKSGAQVTMENLGVEIQVVAAIAIGGELYFSAPPAGGIIAPDSALTPSESLSVNAGDIATTPAINLPAVESSSGIWNTLSGFGTKALTYGENLAISAGVTKGAQSLGLIGGNQSPSPTNQPVSSSGISPQMKSYLMIGAGGLILLLIARKLGGK